MAVPIFVTGVLGIVVGLAGSVLRTVREVETLTPDHVVAKTSDEDDCGPPS